MEKTTAVQAAHPRRSQEADVLAAIALLSEHSGVLRPYAQDTGAFRVGNKGAAELAAACAAALKVAEAFAAVAELVRLADDARNTLECIEATASAGESVRKIARDRACELRAALASFGGAA